MLSEDLVQLIVTLLGLASTLAILSVVYKENAVYRFFEHVFIGVATGYGVVAAWRDILRDLWWEPMVMSGRWYWIVPLLLATLYYTVYSKKHAWMSRFLLTTLLGLYAGLIFRAFCGQIFPQITSSFLPLMPQTAAVTGGDAVTMWSALGNLVFIATLVAVMVYFFFSFRHTQPAVQGTAKLGRWMLMVGFGATFGSTVMARFSLLIDRMDFLVTSPEALGTAMRGLTGGG